MIRANPSGEYIEFAFTFKVRGRFEDFLRTVHLADKVVGSLKLNPSSADLYGGSFLLVKALYLLPFLSIGLIFLFLIALPIGLPPIAAVAMSGVFAVGGGLAFIPMVTKLVQWLSRIRDDAKDG